MGVYKNLNFTNFNLNAPVLNESAGGVLYHSGPNDAFGNLGELGAMVPIVSTAYTGSKVKSFSVNSFYYGCYLQAAQGEVAPAEACTITIAGYKAGASSPAATQAFAFTPEEAVDVQSPPTFGVFSSKFSGLQRITFAVSPTPRIGFIIDNLVGSTVS